MSSASRAAPFVSRDRFRLGGWQLAQVFHGAKLDAKIKKEMMVPNDAPAVPRWLTRIDIFDWLRVILVWFAFEALIDWEECDGDGCARTILPSERMVIALLCLVRWVGSISALSVRGLGFVARFGLFGR